MARTGGRFPFDKTFALSGPTRVLWAETTQAEPVSLKDIVQQVADASGEYPAKTGWNDFGLSAEAPNYSHGKDTEGLEYQQPSGALFEQITDITRQFTMQVAEIEPGNMKIVENSTLTAAIAASVAAATDPNKESAQDKLFAGLYTSLREYRVAMITYRPTGAGVVTEPGPPTVSRPPAVARYFPLVSLAAEESSFDFTKGEPVNAEITFTVNPNQAAGAGKEHGFWLFEQPGAIVA